MNTPLGETELELVVTARIDAADGVVALELATADGTPLPEWSAGAHIDLLLGPDLERQYSLCGDVNDRTRWRVGVLRERDGRGGSEYVHEKLFVGSKVRVRGPRNHFHLEPSPRYIFIAGGIGVTPILPMAATAHAAGAEFEVHYGGRTTTSMAFRDELASYGDTVVLCPSDIQGPLDLPALLAEPRAGTLIYCCGPEALLQAVEAQTTHWPAGALHLERFTPKTVGEPVRTESFEIELASSGKTLTVPPESTILDVVEEAGIQLISSCREGTCGTCETGVLAGEVDHRDSLLTADEQAANDVMFICVSRAACPKLVLDL